MRRERGASNEKARCHGSLSCRKEEPTQLRRMGEILLSLCHLFFGSKLARGKSFGDCRGNRFARFERGEQQVGLPIDASVVDRVLKAMHNQMNWRPLNFR